MKHARLRPPWPGEGQWIRYRRRSSLHWRCPDSDEDPVDYLMLGTVVVSKTLTTLTRADMSRTR